MALPTIDGIDVSHYQAPDSYPDGTGLAMVKASQGGRITDSKVRAHHDALGRRRIPRGPYHFYDCKFSPEENVTRFVAATAGLTWELPHAIDFENASGTYGSKTTTAAKLLRALELLEEKLGRVPMIYTGASWWDAVVAPDPRFARFFLWQARYPDRNATTPPAGRWPTPAKPWPSIDVWQYSDSGGRLDRNVLTEATLARLKRTGPDASRPTTTPKETFTMDAEARAAFKALNDRLDREFDETRKRTNQLRQWAKLIAETLEPVAAKFLGRPVRSPGKLQDDAEAIDS